MSALDTLAMYGRFMAGLPRHLRRRMTVANAEATIREGLAARRENFLRIARRGIFDRPQSPYKQLLDLAGCSYADLQASVRAKGLEPTLAALRAEGVYVTFEEYKGRMPLVRHGRTIPVDEHAFDNPVASKAYEGTTGGSTGRAARVGTDLDNIYAQTPHLLMARHVHGLLGFPTAVWKGTLPDPVGVEVYLRSVVYGGQPERWFTPVSRDDYRPPLRFRLANAYVLWMSRLCGVPCPSPEPLPLDQAIVLARWAADAIQRRGGCQIVASVSLGMRVCLAAREAGIDLTGAHFFGSGEPMTAAKQATFTSVGARHVTFYVSADTGPIGLPCTNPIEENDQHLLEDNLALIQHRREVARSGVEVDAFQFTSLRDRASKILLNTESDDYGIVEERACGCPLEALGYRRHVRGICSFGKLTGEGVTLVGSDMIRILEEVLPGRFGASPQHFQLVEDVDERGFARLTLVVDPAVRVERDERLIGALLEAVRESSVAGGLAQSYWKQAGTFRVRRESPVWTTRGKLPLIRVEGERRADARRAPDQGPN